LVRFDDGVERRGDFARGARRAGGPASGTGAALPRRQDAQHRRAVDPVRAIHALGSPSDPALGCHIPFFLPCLLIPGLTHRLMGTQNSILVPLPGSLTMRHHPPSSCARSRIVTSPLSPGMRTDSGTTKPVPSAPTSTRIPPSTTYSSTTA